MVSYFWLSFNVVCGAMSGFVVAKLFLFGVRFAVKTLTGFRLEEEF